MSIGISYWISIRAHIVDRDITIIISLKTADGIFSYDWGNDKSINLAKTKAKSINTIMEFAGYFENTFYTEPFAKVLLKANQRWLTTSAKASTHTLK